MTRKDHAKQPWLARLLTTKPAKIANVALANKTVRIAWAIMSRGEVYRSVENHSKRKNPNSNALPRESSTQYALVYPVSITKATLLSFLHQQLVRFL